MRNWYKIQRSVHSVPDGLTCTLFHIHHLRNGKTYLSGKGRSENAMVNISDLPGTLTMASRTLSCLSLIHI